MVHETHFSNAVLGWRNVGGVKSQPFLKHSNLRKWPLKNIFKGSGCFQFPEVVVPSTAKESLCYTESGSYKFSLFRRRKYGVESAVYYCNNSVAKVSLCRY